MNHLTRVPNGTETLPGSYNVTFDQYLGILRQFFLPTLRFQCPSVMKGTFGHLRTMYKNKPGVVLMRNKNNFSKIYVMGHQRVALDKLNPQHWMTVFYWNDSGKMPPRPRAPINNPVAMDLGDPPRQPPHPGLASDPNDDADMDDQMNDAPDEDDADFPALEPTYNRHHLHLQCLQDQHLQFQTLWSADT